MVAAFYHKVPELYCDFAAMRHQTSHQTPMGSNLLDRLASRRLIVVTGKGGVGKSTISAVLATALAARGRRALAVEVDPRENLHQLFGVAPSGGEIVPAGRGRSVLHLKPRAVIDRVVEERVRLGPLIRRVQASPVYQHFADAAPGLESLAVLEFGRRLAGEAGHDVVVLDAPASGHGLSLLVAPLVTAEAVGAGGPAGRLAAELSEFVRDRERLGVLVVTQPEEMPVTEALELRAELVARVGREPDGVVVNGLYPPWREAEAGELPAEIAALWHERDALRIRETARLASGWPTPPVELPLLALGRGPALVSALVELWEATP
jgi:Mrp family chromosome partitioning ATPase